MSSEFVREGRLAIRILIADDNPDMRAAMRLVLESAGPWEVVEVSDGDQVLDVVRGQSFNLIILDLAMPGIDGISVARVIAEKYPRVPILMHTLYWSHRVAVEALKVGVRKVIPKSDRATILTAVQEILEAEAAQSPALDNVSLLPETSTTPSPARPSESGNQEQRESPKGPPSDALAPKA